MKKLRKSSIMLMVVLLTMGLLMTGCSESGNVQNDLDEDLGDLAGDLAGSDISTENEWPDYMPESVPKFEDGIIVSTSGTKVGGKDNVVILLESVSEEAFNAYVTEIEGTSYEFLTGSDSGGITVKTYVEGDNALTVQYAAKTGELNISFSGN